MMQFRELGMFYILFGYILTGSIVAYDVAISPLTGDAVILGNVLGANSTDADFEAITEGLRDDLMEDQTECVEDSEGNEVCTDRAIGDAFFGIDFDSVYVFLSLLTGTAIGPLMASFGVDPVFVGLVQAPIAFMNLRTVYYLLTGR